MSSTGTIKKFFEEKGFGFVTPDDGSEDVFAHVQKCPELEGTQPGDAVNYDTKYDYRKGKYNALGAFDGDLYWKNLLYYWTI